MNVKCPYCGKVIKIKGNEKEVVCPDCRKKMIIPEFDEEEEELIAMDEELFF